MEVFQEFYRASKLSGGGCKEAIKKFAHLLLESNLGGYVEHHLTDEQNLEVADFWLEILECKEEMKYVKFQNWLSVEDNWQPFDGNYYAEIAKKDENTSWLEPLLRKHTRCAIDGYFVHFENTFDEKKSIAAHHMIREKIHQKFPNHLFHINCPKDGEIAFVVFFYEDDLTPVFVDRMQMWGLSFKDEEEFQEDSSFGVADRFQWVDENFLLRYPPEWWSGEKLILQNELDY